MPKFSKIFDFRVTGDKRFSVADFPNEIDRNYEGKKDYRKQLDDYAEKIDELQSMMYAHNRYGLLLIFQAMDAAGKDGTIQKVMRGVNPHGVSIHAFKTPSDRELDHDFLWRTTKRLPERGTIGIFNRSYYEEVLVVRVHSEILTKYQRIPAESIGDDLDTVWENRYRSIRDLERHNYVNGIHTLKFFLNVSKKEQAKRFLDRIDRAEKNWKFNEGDVKERGFWDGYMEAYETAINATATSESPWYAIPADNKKTMRLLVCQAVLEKLKSLDIHYPEVSDERRTELQSYRAKLAEKG